MWSKVFRQLASRNRVLYYVVLVSLLGAIVCAAMACFSNLQVGGVRAWIKPMKFYLSLAITAFTLGWVMVYVNNQRRVRRYSWVVVLTMFIELFAITYQAARGRASHFNSSSTFDILVYNVMGLSIVLFTIWTAVIAFQFFKQRQFPLWMSDGYKWGIRLGILFFVLSSFQGLHMAMLNQHSVGGPDGGEGYWLTNWSSVYGDLRVIHFFGMHSMQLLPLLGYYLIKTKWGIIAVALTWLALLVLLYVQALHGYPLFT